MSGKSVAPSLAAHELRFEVPGRGSATLTGVLGRGERLVVRGPSGCGKTTLLRTIAGLHPNQGGELRVGDRSVIQAAPSDRGVGMVFQEGALFPFLTVLENVAFGLRYRATTRDLSDELRRARALALLRHFGLAEFANRAPAGLSGGEAQRISLLRALIIEPEVLLLDEPLSKLDADNRARVADWMLRVCAERGMALIVVSHYDDELARSCERQIEWPPVTDEDQSQCQLRF